APTPFSKHGGDKPVGLGLLAFQLQFEDIWARNYAMALDGTLLLNDCDRHAMPFKQPLRDAVSPCIVGQHQTFGRWVFRPRRQRRLPFARHGFLLAWRPLRDEFLSSRHSLISGGWLAASPLFLRRSAGDLKPNNPRLRHKKEPAARGAAISSKVACTLAL